ncbi:MAG TPA: hypothetical protein VHH73_00050 [Verrucomicrobiae bacterium]|nr:hypothetical protein [Verrucomicrobiae bacterium]
MAAAFACLAAEQAAAFTYSDTDLLLVFRQQGLNDVEFNLGSINNFLGKPDGTQIPVTNWDLNLVRQNYNNNLGGVSVILMAATDAQNATNRVWLTDGNANGTPTDVSGSKWGQLRSKISFAGLEAQTSTGTNNVQSYAVSGADVSSYTAIVSNNGGVDVTTMGGLAPFPVEGQIPATMRFFEIKVNNNNPKPPATQIGSFNITADGTLTFTAGAAVVQPGPIPPPSITGISKNGNTAIISFTTTNTVSYRLRYTGALAAGNAVGNWSTATGTVAGNGGVQTLQDTSGDAARFYSVEAYR